MEVEEYLNTTYRPDCDYLDGVVVERNAGRSDHSLVQAAVATWFRARRSELGIHALLACRLQVGPWRYRVPDVCVVPRNRPVPPVLVEPPLLCIEVLSPEDRLSPLQDRLDEYLVLGVPVSWVLDPETRRAWTMTTEGLREVRDGVLRLLQPKVELPLAEVFEDLPPLSA